MFAGVAKCRSSRGFLLRVVYSKFYYRSQLLLLIISLKRANATARQPGTLFKYLAITAAFCWANLTRSNVKQFKNLPCFTYKRFGGHAISLTYLTRADHAFCVLEYSTLKTLLVPSRKQPLCISSFKVKYLIKVRYFRYTKSSCACKSVGSSGPYYLYALQSSLVVV